MRRTRGNSDTTTPGQGGLAVTATGDWTAVIVNYNGEPFLTACLEAITKVRLQPREVLVVDNASTDESLLELHGYPWAIPVPQRENLGYAGGANAGLELVETSYAVVMNPDVELSPDFGDALVRAFQANPKLGAAGALLLYPGGETVQHAGGTVAYPSLLTDHRGRGQPLSPEFEREVDIDFATGAALALRMDAVRQVGGFDERLAPAYYEDVDICARIRSAGWQVRLVPSMRAIHHEGVTLQRSADYYNHLYRNRLRYALKHLAPGQWRRDFVPAEIARLRHEIHNLPDGDWRSVTGAGALDQLLQDIEGATWASATALPEIDFPVNPIEIEELRDWRTGVWPGGPRPRGSRVRDLLMKLGLRKIIAGLLVEQHAFNDAVVRALDAQAVFNRQQDQLNRELLATTLMYAAYLLSEMGQRRATDSLCDRLK